MKRFYLDPHDGWVTSQTWLAGLVHHFSIEEHGTIVLVRPLTEAALEWLNEHTDGTWFGGALVVEPRYVEDLIVGAMEDLPVPGGSTTAAPREQ